MAKILLGVTGSVAATRTPQLFESLKQHGHSVRIVATDASLYFFDKGLFDADALYVDADEWPGQRYRRDDPVLHIELRRWAELLVIAPLDANTLAKLSVGISDNCLTCVWRAWDVSRPVLLAPAMNTLMWENPLTLRHLRDLATVATGLSPSTNAGVDELIDWLNSQSRCLRIVGPISKKLACGDIGVGAMAEVNEVVEAVQQLLASR